MPLTRVAADLNVGESTLTKWLAAQRAESPEPLSISEREELKQLRKENATLRMERDILKKSDGVLWQSKRLKFARMKSHEEEFEVQAMSKIMNTSRAGYYAWRRRPVSTRDRANDALAVRIRAQHAASRATWQPPDPRLPEEGWRSLQPKPGHPNHSTSQRLRALPARFRRSTAQ